MKKIRIIIVLKMISFSCFAQFSDINPFPTHNVGNLKDVFLTDSNEIFVSLYGSYNSIVKSTILKKNSDSDWQYVNIGPNDGEGMDISKINNDSFLIYFKCFYLTPDKFNTYIKIADYPRDINNNPIYPRYLKLFNNSMIVSFEKKITNPDTVGTYISKDFGKTWKKACNTTIQEIGFIDNNTGYGIGYGETVEFNRIFKTKDGGNSWFDLHSQNDTGGSYEFRFKEHFYSLSSKSELRRSDDEGKTWKIKDGKLPSDFKFVNAHKFLSATTGIVYNYKYGVYKTTNAGDSWEKLSDYISTSPVSRIYSLLQNGKVYLILAEYNNSKTSMVYGVFDSAAVFTNSLPEQKTKTQFYIYPNPTKNNVTISYTGFISSATKVRLYDMQGKLLKEQSFGLGETVVNLENFSKGVYILKINEDKGVFVHKIIKE